jgi:hypothetical protein
MNSPVFGRAIFYPAQHFTGVILSRHSGDFPFLSQLMAGKNRCFELTQNRLSEKLQPMLKNRHLAIALLNTYFEENRQFDDLF